MNFSNNQNASIETSTSYSQYGNSFGDVQLVSGEVVEDEETEDDDEENDDEILDEEDLSEEDSEEDEIVTTSATDVNAYFTELKLKRDNIYSEKLESYRQIAQSDSISSDQKAIAIQEIENITETQNAIEVAEELIKLKGFENVIIYVNNDSVSVIVRSSALTSEEVAQIQNIVVREFNVDLSQISISSK